tara:strand:- start:276 stop:776 length:501 start_codon:yes stop_codon:yes gene_type:complete
MPRSKFIYLESQSGRTESFEDFRKRLSKLGTSEGMRFREVRKVLMKEAQPLVTEARNQAYAGSQEKKGGRLKTMGKGGAAFRNLYGSIGKWANKGTEKAYVIVGLRGQNKRPAGAFYAVWQMFGGTAKNFKAKDFLGKAVRSTNVVEKAQRMMQKHIQKRITSILR